jgi:hypothetical protein
MKPQEHDIMRSFEDHYWWKGVAVLELAASRHVSLPFGTSVFAVARKHG